MGTNFYHETRDRVAQSPHKRCDGCGQVLRCDRCEGEHRGEHIGKSSAGWTFSFHATDTERSWADWQKRLGAGGHIVDEYGKLWPLDEFRALVAAKAGEGRRNHAREFPDDRNFLDPEGHSFSEGEFS